MRNEEGQIRFRISPEGRVNEYIYNDEGELSESLLYTNALYATGDWVLTEIDLQTWHAHQQDLEVERELRFYDARGMLSRLERYQNNTYEATSDSLATTVQYIHSENGQLLKTIDNFGKEESFHFDGIGRLLSTVNKLDETVVSVFDDQNQRIITTEKDGLVTTSNYNNVGQVVSSTQYSPDADISRETSFVYDDLGRLRSQQNAIGERKYCLYDVLGRKTAEVDERGALKEYQYDKSGNQTQTTQFSKLLDTSAFFDGGVLNEGLLVLDDLRGKATDLSGEILNRNSYQIFDALNRVRFSISQDGYVIERAYDGRGLLVREIEYQDPITLVDGLINGLELTEATVLAILKNAALVTISNDLVTSEFDHIQPYDFITDASEQLVLGVNQDVLVNVIGVAVNGPFVEPYPFIANADIYNIQNISLQTEYTQWGNAEGIYPLSSSATQDIVVETEHSLDLNSVDLGGGIQGINWSLDPWTQDFSLNSQGLSGLGGSFSEENGRLAARSVDVAGAEPFPRLEGERLYNASSGLVYTAEVTTDFSETNRYFKIGLTSGSGLNRHEHYLYLTQGAAYSRAIVGVSTESEELFDLKNNTTYVVEINVDGTGSTLTFYEKSLGVDFAVSFSRDAGGWGETRSYMEIHNSETKKPNAVFVDNIVERGERVDLTTYFSFKKETEASFSDPVEVQVINGRYELALEGLENVNYDFQITQENSDGLQISSSEGIFKASENEQLVLTQNRIESSSNAIVGSSITNYIDPLEYGQVDFITAEIYNSDKSINYGEALTIPRVQENYDGSVNLRLGESLPPNLYRIEITVHLKDGSIRTDLPFLYDVGDVSTSKQITLSWPVDSQEWVKTDIKYSVLNADGTAQSWSNWLPVSVVGDSYKVVFEGFENNDNYVFHARQFDIDDVEQVFAIGAFQVLDAGAGRFNQSVTETSRSIDVQSVGVDAGASLQGVLGDYVESGRWSGIDFVQALVRNPDNHGTISSAKTYPEAYENYSGDINLKNDGLFPDGRYEIVLFVHYKNGTIDTFEPFIQDFGGSGPLTGMTQTLSWPTNIFDLSDSTDHTFLYRLADSGDDYTEIEILEIGVNFEVTLENLTAFGYYEFKIEQNDGHLTHQGQLSNQKHGRGLFQARVGEEPTSVTFNYTELTKTDLQGMTLQGIFTDEEINNIDYVLVDVFDESDSTYLATHRTYARAYTDYDGRVIVSTDGLLADGSYRLSLQVYTRSGKIISKIFVYQMGPQTVTQRQTKVEIINANVEVGQTLWYQIPMLTGDSYSAATYDADTERWYIIAGEKLPIGGYDMNLQVREGSVVVKEPHLMFISDNDDRQILLQIEDEAPTEGRFTQYFYHEDGLLEGIVDAGGFMTQYLYDAGGRLIETIKYATYTGLDFIAGASGIDFFIPDDSDDDAHQYFFYDGRGNKLAEIDGEGYLTTYSYYERDQVSFVTHYGESVIYTDQKISELMDLANSIEKPYQMEFFAYDALSRVITHYDQSTLVTFYEYDSNGKLARIQEGYTYSDEMARYKNIRHDQFGNIESELSGKGGFLLEMAATEAERDEIWDQYASHYRYDDMNRLVEKQGPLRIAMNAANGALFETRSEEYYYYSQSNLMTYRINSLGEVTEFTHTAFNKVEETIRYAGTISVLGLNGGEITSVLLGRIASIQSENDTHITTIYDDLGRVQQRVGAEGEVSTRTYNGYNELESLTKTINRTIGRSETTFYTYDNRGLQLTKTQDFGVGKYNVITENRYDAFGRLQFQIDANNNSTEFKYDRIGQVLSVIDPSLNSTHTTYDAFGQVLTQTDAADNTTIYTYNRSQRKTEIVTPEGILVSIIRNQHGDEIKVTDGEGHYTVYGYDSAGNVETVERFDKNDISTGRVAYTEYDSVGQIKVVIDANDTEIHYEYDAVGRQLKRTLDPTGLNLSSRYIYDTKGQQIKFYDAADRLTITKYDKSGNVERITTDADNSGLQLVTSFQYDDLGNKVRVSRGQEANLGQEVTSFEYDNLGRLEFKIVDPDGAAIRTGYEYDDNGNLTKRVDPGSNEHHYFYDDSNRLRYSVDAVGAVTKNEYDENDRIINVISYSITISTANLETEANIRERILFNDSDVLARTFYDADGRVDFSSNGLGGITSYFYDDANNVVALTRYLTPILNAGSFTAEELAAHVLNNVDDSYTTRTVYDANNRAILSVDSRGVLTGSSFDAVGNLVTQTVYDSLPTITNTAKKLALEDISIANSPMDQVNYFFYDNLGRQTHSVNAMGYATTQAYDDMGNVLLVEMYAESVSVTTSTTSSQLDSMLAALDKAENRFEHSTYDDLSRLRYTVNTEGYVTEQIYDDLSHVIEVIEWKDKYLGLSFSEFGLSSSLD
ncbi:MAG: RHS repeat protein, partial [Flavobacteriales bacterium]|nr:RHS repeat protein [Flavobacteriales bacterium]